VRPVHRRPHGPKQYGSFRMVRAFKDALQLWLEAGGPAVTAGATTAPVSAAAHEPPDT
jgi:hypothetical protein